VKRDLWIRYPLRDAASYCSLVFLPLSSLSSDHASVPAMIEPASTLNLMLLKGSWPKKEVEL